MWFWNRIEIYCGYSMKEFSDLKESLASKGIKYECRYEDISSNSRNYRSNIEFITQDKKNSTKYYLYVHKKDYENVMFLTSNRYVR